MTRGRPKLPAGEAKAGTIVLRLRHDDRAAIEAAAHKSGKSVSDYVRDTLLPKTPAVPDEPTRLRWWDNDKPIYVETPSGLSRQAWERLKKYIDVIEPKATLGLPATEEDV